MTTGLVNWCLVRGEASADFPHSKPCSLIASSREKRRLPPQPSGLSFGCGTSQATARASSAGTGWGPNYVTGEALRAARDIHDQQEEEASQLLSAGFTFYRRQPQCSLTASSRGEDRCQTRPNHLGSAAEPIASNVL
jgi:hypothetical protein